MRADRTAENLDVFAFELTDDRMSTRGRTLEQEGFVHCSTRARLPAVAAFLYSSYEDPDELVVLVGALRGWRCR